MTIKGHLHTFCILNNPEWLIFLKILKKRLNCWNSLNMIYKVNLSLSWALEVILVRKLTFPLLSPKKKGERGNHISFAKQNTKKIYISSFYFLFLNTKIPKKIVFRMPLLNMKIPKRVLSYFLKYKNIKKSFLFKFFAKHSKLKKKDIIICFLLDITS